MASRLSPPIPNLTHLTRCLINYIANHPLIVNTTVHHPITGKPVSIESYRNFDGIELRKGLTCSVFPYASSSNVPSPGSTNVSSYYDTYDLGSEGHDVARFNIAIKYSLNEVLLGNTTSMQVPISAIYGQGQKLLTSNTKRDVILEINPGIEIIQDYLSITKYIIDDIVYKKDFPIAANSFQMMYQNVKSERWEEGDTIYFQEGVAMTLFEAYVSRGWRDILAPSYTRQPIIKTTLN